MSHETCAHCNVEITHHDTAVTREGKTYCCANCADAAQKAFSQDVGLSLLEN